MLTCPKYLLSNCRSYILLFKRAIDEDILKLCEYLKENMYSKEVFDYLYEPDGAHLILSNYYIEKYTQSSDSMLYDNMSFELSSKQNNNSTVVLSYTVCKMQDSLRILPVHLNNHISDVIICTTAIEIPSDILPQTDRFNSYSYCDSKSEYFYSVVHLTIDNGKLVSLD